MTEFLRKLIVQPRRPKGTSIHLMTEILLSELPDSFFSYDPSRTSPLSDRRHFEMDA